MWLFSNHNNVGWGLLFGVGFFFSTEEKNNRNFYQSVQLFQRRFPQDSADLIPRGRGGRLQNCLWCFVAQWWADLGQLPTQLLTHWPCLTAQGKKRRKSLWVEIKPRRSPSNYCHGRNRLDLGKIHLVVLPIENRIGW